jgi:hypothetical protein
MIVFSAIEEVAHKLPKSGEKTAFVIPCGVVGLTALLFRAPPAFDLSFRPLSRPLNPAASDHVMGFTGQLPISDGWI